jgi:hypothetical protein
MSKPVKTWSLTFDPPEPFETSSDRKENPGGWTDVDLSRLVARAKEAFEQKRLKNCLTMTKILLQADPGNDDALALASAIETAIQEDLRNARALLDNAQFQDKPQVFARGAEIILARVLNVDPENEEAKLLRSIIKIRLSEVVSRPVVVTEALEALPEPLVDLPDPPEVELPISAAAATDSSAVEEADPEPAEARFSNVVQQGARLAIPIALAVLIAVVIGVMLSGWLKPQLKSIASSPVKPAEPADAYPRANTNVVQPSTPIPPLKQNTVQAIAAASVVLPKPPRTPVVANATGTLALNSALPAEIYMGDKYLGSTPTTLNLPAGTHTLEYRHQNLRKVVSHVVSASETTPARITFEMRVQINARPWAQVFIEGAEKQSLGQTPLSGVVVPAGSTLVFENPNFPGKSYRVTGTETAIQVVFP